MDVPVDIRNEHFENILLRYKLCLVYVLLLKSQNKVHYGWLDRCVLD